MRGFAVRPTAAGLGLAFLGAEDLHNPFGAVQTFLSSGDALLDSLFDSERLKAALSWFGAQSGPPMSHPATAPMIGFAALMHNDPAGAGDRRFGVPADALASVARHGGTITAGPVHRHPGPVALARAHRRRPSPPAGRWWRRATCTRPDLLSGELPAPTVDRWRRRIRPGFGLGMVVRLGTTDLPRYPDVPTRVSSHGLQLLVTDRRHLDRRYGVAAAGGLDADPAVLAMSFSSLDPSLAPAGRHELTLWSQWHPRNLADGRPWSDAGAAEADRIIAAADRFAPGLAGSIVHRHVQTPEDLETELGLIGGNVMHVEMSLDQMADASTSGPARSHGSGRGRHLPGRRLHPSRRRGDRHEWSDRRPTCRSPVRHVDTSPTPGAGRMTPVTVPRSTAITHAARGRSPLARRLAGVTALFTMLFVLSGCLQLNAQMSVRKDDTVSGRILIAADQLAQAAARTVNALRLEQKVRSPLFSGRVHGREIYSPS